MRESLIENDGVKWARDRSWLARKNATPGSKGALDHRFHKNGVTFYIEFKTTGEKATPLQVAEAEALKRAGIPCRCCDNVQDARDFIDTMTKTAEEDDPHFDIIVLAEDLTSFYV